MTAITVDELVTCPDYVEFGHARISRDGLTVVAVDHARHPLHVWQPSDHPAIGYVRTARRHDVVATNGPMVGRSMPVLGKVTRVKLVTGTIAPVLGAFPALVACRRRAAIGLAAMSVFAGVAVSAAMLGRWTACGHVVSGGRRTTATFDGEGSEHAFLAVLGTGAIVIGDGHPPTEATEALGGLVRLVEDGRVPVLPLPARSPAVAWGVARRGDRDVVLVVGGASLDLRRLAAKMAGLGVGDAVATDPSGCAMLVHRGRFVLGPPRWHRRAIQRVGLACGTSR